jgi:acyl-CoA synthetase (AMP-forming)/AMP-acid ligase II
MEFNLADLWERVADTVPDHEALVCADRRLTFAEADTRATRLAHALAERGVGPGDHVACYLYNSIEYLEVMLAAFKLRAVPINVNYRYVEDELRYLLDDADFLTCTPASRSTTAPRRHPPRSTHSTMRRRSTPRVPNGPSVPAPPTTYTSCTPAERPACPKG